MPLPLYCPQCGRVFRCLLDMEAHRSAHFARTHGLERAFVKHLTVEDRTFLRDMRIGWPEDGEDA
jgi:hypothetical protein